MNQTTSLARVAAIASHVPPNYRDSKKEVGLGMPPEQYGDNADMCLADQCDPRARVVIAEVARWRIDTPLADTTIGGPLGDRINVWGTPDGQPPQGITTATNTLATPGIFASDMIIRGLSVRVLVEPEGRLITGMYYVPGSSAALPGMADVWTQNDITNGALGGPAGLSPLAAELLFGINTWKSAFSFVNAYELVVGKDHQESIVKEPLTQVAHIEPFAEAEAAGMVFGTNQDRVNELNQRLINIGQTGQFLPTMFKRLGSVTNNAANNVSVFTPSREQDGSLTMFGAVGVPQNLLQKDPYLFTTPIFWPAGHPMSMFFEVNDQVYQSSFQRWLSVTGGSGGQAGADLALPVSNLVAGNGSNGLTPSATNNNVIMLEQTLDNAPVTITQQVQANRTLLKLGAMVLEVAVIGLRISNPKWGPVVAKAIKQGAISAPRGYGNLTSYLMQ